MNTRQVEEYIRRLKRRQEYLEERVEGKEEEKSHYDRAELKALTWIIRYTEDTLLEAAEHQYKWFQEQKENHEQDKLS